jgi:pyridoxal phosphate enzyme (YggS family)
MNRNLENNLAVRLNEVTNRIVRAAGRAGRDPADITLVAVTKTWSAEMVVAAYSAGIRHVGENRAEEMAHKKAQVIEMLHGIDDLVWHQIGTLQSRKTGLVADNADFFHALDRLKIARRLSGQLSEISRTLPVLLEINLSGEQSKSGYMADNWEKDATQRESLRNVIETIAQLPGLDLQGIMTMAPWGVEDELIRSIFRRTRLLADWLQKEAPQIKLDQLSMGMSDDFEIAIEEGATYVRVGRAIFGSRQVT